MVGRIVADQINLRGIVNPEELLQEEQIGFGIEYGVCAVVETRAIEVDGPKDFAAVSASGRGNLGLRTYLRPRLVERRVFPEARFVFVEDLRPFRFGVFFSRGRV